MSGGRGGGIGGLCLRLIEKGRLGEYDTWLRSEEGRERETI